MEALQTALDSADRTRRVAAIESALHGKDVAMRRFAMDAALDSRDPLLAHLALRNWLARQKTLSVLLYATKEDPTSPTVLNNLGPLTIKLDNFDPSNGALTGTMGAPGFDVTRTSAAAGSLAQTALALNTFGCQLAVQLSAFRTLDGTYRCQYMPALVARIIVD